MTDAGARGTLQIADRVIDRIAAHSALLTDGVVPTGSELEKLIGRKLPKASSDVHGDRVRVSLDIAVTWPLNAADVARNVRRDVAAAVAELAGMKVLGVDVSVVRMERHHAPARRRVQ